MTQITIGFAGGRLGDLSANSVASILRQKAGLAVAIQKPVSSSQSPINSSPDEADAETQGLLHALEKGRLDAAVMPVSLISDVCSQIAIAAFLPREDPADVILIKPQGFSGSKGLLPLRQSRVVLCTSRRALSQARHLRHDLRFRELDTGASVVERWKDNSADALILPAIELDRELVKTGNIVVSRLEPERFVPAPCQGIAIVLMRREDAHIAAVHTALHDEDSRIASEIERQVGARFVSRPPLALGTFARREDQIWWAYGYCAQEATQPVWAETECTSYQLLAEELYLKLAETEDETLPR